MSDLVPFSYQDQEIRVLSVNGEPWFVLADLCKVLDLSNPSMVAERLDSDALSAAEVIDSMGRKQRARIVSEPGMYQTAFMSRKSEAAAFRRWVTHEVLPSIRRRGGYLTPEAAERALTDPDFIIRLATELKAERAARAEVEAQAAAQSAELEAARPKALFADAVACSDTEILVGELAKILKGNGVHQAGGTRLFKWLRRKGYLIKRPGADWNMPTQRSMELGLFRIKETAVTHSDGHVSISKTPKVTGKGQVYFVEGFLSGRFNAEELTMEEAA